LGIIGGTTWQATIEYYRHINTSINLLYRSQTNPPIIVYNLNQAHIHALQCAGAWCRIAELLRQASLCLEAAGCQGLLFASNTAHKVFDDVADKVSLPIVHIADAIGVAARQASFSTVGLIGSIFTMEGDFLSRRLLEGYSIQALPPASSPSRARLHEIIQRKMTRGKPDPDSKGFILDEIALLQARGAEAVVLGGTALSSFINQRDVDLPLLDATLAHARLAVDFILGAGSE